MNNPNHWMEVPREPTLVRVFRTIVTLIGLAMIGLVVGALWYLLPEFPVQAVFLSIPLLTGGVTLLRHGITGRHATFDKLRGDSVRRHDYIRQYHGDAD